MKINRNNYEVFFLDYYEGNLPAEQVAELFLFLEENPQFKSEFDSFETIILKPSSIINFPEKAWLKKGSINEENYVRFFIGYVEGTLTETEKQELVVFLQNYPAYKSDFSLFEKTKIHPDFQLVYPDKKGLKKPIPFYQSQTTWYYVAAAACIVFLVGVLFLTHFKIPEPQTAQKTFPVLKKGNSGNPEKNMLKPLIQNKDSNEQEDKKTKSAFTVINKKHVSPINKVIKQNAQHFTGLNSGKIDSLNNNLNHHKLPSHEFITLLTPIEFVLPLANTEKQKVLAQQKNHKSDEYHTLIAGSLVKGSYPTIGETFRQLSFNKLQTITGSKPLSENLTNNKVNGRIKGIKLMSWVMAKISGNKVIIKTTYSSSGELKTYRISAGRLQFGKTFALR